MSGAEREDTLGTAATPTPTPTQTPRVASLPQQSPRTPATVGGGAASPGPATANEGTVGQEPPARAGKPILGNEDDRVGETVRRSFLHFLDTFAIQGKDEPAAEQNTEGESLEMTGRGTTTQATGAAAAGALRRPYVDQVVRMASTGRTTIHIDFDHLSQWDAALATEVVEAQFYRFEGYLRRAVAAFVRKHQPAFADAAAAAAAHQNVGQQPLQPLYGANPDAGAAGAEATDSGSQGGRDFFLSFSNLPTVLHMRGLRTERVGQLSSFCGTVTRVSEVRPELVVASFRCGQCGTERANVVQQFRFTQPTSCANPTCGNRTNFVMLRDSCKFVDWQRLRVQENPDEVPPGCMPRSVDVIVRGENVEKCRAGDRVVFCGTLVALPDEAAQMGGPGKGEGAQVGGRRAAAGGRSGAASAAGEGIGGLKALGARQLTYKLAFMANSARGAEPGAAAAAAAAAEGEGEVDAEGAPHFTEEELQEIGVMRSDQNLYSNLVNSMAPKVFGHSDIKRAILLMLFGGVQKQSREGVKLRGDINVCVVGDPACAKSQFLKYVASFMPRTVYTSGKASSAAGLTASVVKDMETGEFCIEAGALMLADNGICCIDEFDKMDQKDQVAIHEAMEQQTISISKAGIQATLNARTSILAAANPAGGRYDKARSLKHNVALPPAILSRFDLIHVMIDEPDDAFDYNLAQHIVRIHQRKAEALQPVYTSHQLRRYITYARQMKPALGRDAAVALRESYVRLRSSDVQPGQAFSYRMTVRQLESLIRLCEALARVHCEREITPVHVREAERLLRTSIITVEAHDVDLERAPMPDSLRDFIRHGQQVIQDRSEGQQGEAGEQQGGGEDAFKDLEVPTTVSYDKYREAADMIVSYLTAEEEKALARGDEFAGIKQASIMRWYMDEQSKVGKFTSLNEMAEEYLLLQRIVEYLVHNDQTLIVTEDAAPDGEGNADLTERVLAVSPNFVADA